jgi:AbrB family looped-hinge helix DNA binding protein
MSVEVRRVQKLGASSLVVTIPKDWARRLGIEPGTRVYVIDEGDSVRIIPVNHGQGEVPVLEAPPNPAAASNLVVCVYLSGLSEARVRVRSHPDIHSILLAMKDKAFSLLGVQVDELGEGEAFVRVALDLDKLDLGNLIRSLSTNASRALALLEKIIGGTPPGNIRMDAELLERDFLRNQYAIIRYLMVKHASTLSLVSNYYTALATGYIGFAIDILINLIKILPENSRLEDGELERATRLIRRVEEAVTLETRILASPSVRRIGELLAMIKLAREEAREAMLSAGSPLAAIIYSKLHDVIRIVNLSSYVALCRALMEAASNKR